VRIIREANVPGGIGDLIIVPVEADELWRFFRLVGGRTATRAIWRFETQHH